MEYKLQLTAAQARFATSKSNVRGFVGGRGSGKSFVGAADVLLRAQGGQLLMVVAPTYTQLKDTSCRSFIQLANEMGVLVTLHHNDMRATIRANGGNAEVLFRSGDNPDRLRGPNLSGAWLDEASVMTREVYEIMLASMREGGQHGWLSNTFTPKGRSHWTYELFGKNKPGVELVSARTTDNPFLPPEFYESVKAQYGSLLAKQELEGEFVEIEGSEWPSSYFGPEIWYDIPPTVFETKVLGIDPSKGKDAKSGDYSAFVFIGVDDKGTLWVDAEILRLSAPLIPAYTFDLFKRWKPDAIAIETNQFQELLMTEMLREGSEHGVPLPVVPINNTVNKLIRIRRLGPYLARGQVRFKANSPGCEMLISQLREFPEGEHDDGPDAFEGSLRVAQQMLAVEEANAMLNENPSINYDQM